MVKSDAPQIATSIRGATSPQSRNRETLVDPRTEKLFGESIALAESEQFIADEERMEDASVGGAMNVPTALRSMLLGVSQVAPTQAGQDIAAHIERMAAAIAEVTKSGVAAEFQLTLPASPIPVDGAIIGRDQSGAIHVMLTSPHEVPAAQAAMLQASLHDRLRQRDIRIGKVELKKVNARR